MKTDGKKKIVRMNVGFLSDKSCHFGQTCGLWSLPLRYIILLIIESANWFIIEPFFFLAPKASDQSTMMNQLASLQLMKTGMLSHASHSVYLWTTDFKSSELLSFLMDMLGYFRDEVEVPVDRILTGMVKTLFRLIWLKTPSF